MQDLLLSQQEFQHFGDTVEPNRLEMLEEIHRTGGDADKYLAKPKTK
jgi:ureidoglycolate hydrolase